MQTFFIRTYGCQMNELDSQIIYGMLERRGLKETFDENNADLLIFNTCSIRDLAERKVLGKLGLLFRQKKNRVVGIAGCMAAAKKENLFKKFPKLSFVIGPNNLADLDGILDSLAPLPELTLSRETNHILKTSDSHTENIDYLLAKRDGISAYVSIIRGCNNFCSYCIVPYTRGREVSRPYQDIVKEVKELAGKGVREITLLGQNVNSYGKDRYDNVLFCDLLQKLDAIEGVSRIRFMTSHPKDITKELMYAIRDLPSVCEFVHFPVQSGSNDILKAMNRKYTIEDYLEKALSLKEIVPSATLGTDIIVGFPNETANDFQKTCQIMEKIRFSQAFIFAYSKRSGTAAAKMDDNIPLQIKKERLQELLKLYHRLAAEDALKAIGKDVEVLVERATGNILKGLTRTSQKVIFPGVTNLVGSLQTVRLKQYKNQTFIAEPII